MKSEDLVRQWCKACEREYGEDCWACLLYGFLVAVENYYKKGSTMAEEMRNYMRSAPPPEGARERLEKVLGSPLHIAQMLLREIEDYEKCHKI